MTPKERADRLWRRYADTIPPPGIHAELSNIKAIAYPLIVMISEQQRRTGYLALSLSFLWVITAAALAATVML